MAYPDGGLNSGTRVAARAAGLGDGRETVALNVPMV